LHQFLVLFIELMPPKVLVAVEVAVDFVDVAVFDGVLLEQEGSEGLIHFELIADGLGRPVPEEVVREVRLLNGLVLPNIPEDYVAETVLDVAVPHPHLLQRTALQHVR
jgi:hypothetical protein